MSSSPDKEDKVDTFVASEIAEGDEQLPVVARLMVEIRSDGSRTIARGAMEDLVHQESVTIEARGESPMSLALELARSIVKTRSLALRKARALLPPRPKLLRRKK